MRAHSLSTIRVKHHIKGSEVGDISPRVGFESLRTRLINCTFLRTRLLFWVNVALIPYTWGGGRITA
jgi:hypothetical protein